jgi:hypothetical protein
LDDGSFDFDAGASAYDSEVVVDFEMLVHHV